MLELKPNCENCNAELPSDAQNARICSFECTFCTDCVDNVLKNVCPNCTGGFVPRPFRSKEMLLKYPARKEPLFKPVDMQAQEKLIAQFGDIPPQYR